MDAGARIACEDDPGFGLASVARCPFLGRLIVGMDLNRQVLARVEELDKERKTVHLSAEKFNAVLGHQLPERRAGTWAVRHLAAVKGMIAQQPGLADGLVGRKSAAKPLAEALAAPGHRPQEWFEDQWRRDA